MQTPWEEAATCGICGSGRSRFTEAVGTPRFAVCRECGVERLYDRIREDRLDLLYATYYAPTDPTPDALERQLANPTFTHRRARLEQWIGSRSRRLLEIGCGDGNFLAVTRRAALRSNRRERPHRRPRHQSVDTRWNACSVEVWSVCRSWERASRRRSVGGGVDIVARRDSHAR